MKIFYYRILIVVFCYFCIEFNFNEKVLFLILFFIFILVDSERDVCFKRNFVSMICVFLSNSISLGRECDINVVVGLD